MRKPDSLSHPSHLEKVALYEQWAPGPLQAFRNLAEQCFANGALSTQDKELIAVGCAHVLRCPYCIDHHINLASQAGAEKPALAEAIWVGIAMKRRRCVLCPCSGCPADDGRRERGLLCIRCKRPTAITLGHGACGIRRLRGTQLCRV